MKTIKVGDKVICNGNPQGRVIFIHMRDGVQAMADVRLWQGLRHVGDVTVCIASLLREQEVAA